ncbi:MAG TPA: hypothetical protein VMS08_04345 [Candidatus Saccharimonadia bacterium]|nr:hypothetical protein [Candidatus Saccharimonadia bacterium]
MFNTSTQTWAQADQSTFTCDAATGYYLSPEYYYDKQDGWYEIIPASSAAALPSYFITAPNVVHTALGDLVVGSPDYQMAQALGLLNTNGGILVPADGSGSDNQTAVNNSGQSWVDLTSLVNVINTLQSTANSGNTAASSNTQVGDSQTGAASVIADLFNLLASAWSWSNGNLNFFQQTLCDFNQTCNGNVTLNPGQSASGGGGTLGTSGTTNTNVNAQNSGNILNNVNLGAQSGDASATDNTAAGNVSSGNALAEVNIMNLINSFINSGSSFFGVLNIFGTLNGNILFPAGFLNGLVPSGTTPAGASQGASTTGPGSTNGTTTDNNTQSQANSTVANSIANNVATTAATGAASAESNTEAGSVASGVANTMQSLFNLANTSIFGQNAVLVIVNISGHWVGKIMNMAGGSTESALLTGGATVSPNITGPDSTNQSTTNNNSNSNINEQSEGSITNNVNVGAQSGTADASKNTQVGNVASGNAEAVASVANITNSVINASHWFGVLVINVVGSWLGDIGVVPSTSSNGYSPVGSAAGTSQANSVFAALPKTGAYAQLAGASLGGSGNGQVSSVGTSPQVSSKVLTAAAAQPAAESVASIAKGKDMSVLFALSAGVMLIAGALASIDKKLKRR